MRQHPLAPHLWALVAALAACSSCATPAARPAAPGPTASCDLASAEACLTLADELDAGKSRPRDPRRALEIAREWCARGDSSACQALGRAYARGLSGHVDQAASQAVCFDGPVAARAEWCAELGRTIDAGGPGSQEVAGRALERACAGAGVGCVAQAMWLFRCGDRGGAAVRLQGLCERRVEHACNGLLAINKRMEVEARDAGTVPSTPPGALHLRASDLGVTYDPPGEAWGTSIPVRRPGTRQTIWRWWALGREIAVSVVTASGGSTGVVGLTLPELARESTRKFDWAQVDGRAGEHLSGETDQGWAVDLYSLVERGVLYQVRVISRAGRDQAFLAAALAGLHIDAR